MGLAAKLKVQDGDLRGAFNQRATPLIEALRTDRGNRAAMNDLAALTLDACNHFLAMQGQVRYPSGVSGEDIVQEATMRLLDIARDHNKVVASPYDYFSVVFRNTFLSELRGHHDVVMSALDDKDSERADYAATISGDGRRDNHRHDHLMGELLEEYGSDLDTMIANNGFTPAEKRIVEQEIKQVIKTHGWEQFGSSAHEYYLGDLVQPGFLTREEKAHDLPEGSLKTKLFHIRKYLHRDLAEHYPDSYEHSLRDKLVHLEEFRRTNREALPEPMADRHYITPTEMIHKMHRGSSTAIQSHIHRLLLDMISTRKNELITLDDETIMSAEDVFVARNSNPRHGGKWTIYIDDKAQGFLQEELHVHPKRKDWLPLSRFNVHIGKPSHEKDCIDTFNHMYDLWSNNRRIKVEGKKRPAREYITMADPYRGHVAEFMHHLNLPEELENRAMYLSPKLRDYAREHLPCHPEEQQKDWLRLRGEKGKGVLQKLHISGRGRDGSIGVATYLATIMMLEELNKQDTITYGEPPVTKPKRELLGKYLVDGKHSPLEQHGIWLVSEELVGEGKPLNRKDIVALRTEILENKERYPRFKIALDASHRVRKDGSHIERLATDDEGPAGGDQNGGAGGSVGGGFGGR